MELHINNNNYDVGSDEKENLLTVLRNTLDLTGSKYGCGEGVCGACTVLVDGGPVRSCITRIETLKGKKITTIEGLEKDGRLNPIQEAFLQEEAFQCGYCTSGMIMSSVALLDKNQKPSEVDIIQHMNGNICRCGVYPRIVKAIKSASVKIAKG
jgi:aerobic-type carbon monoxide dehydrogenase small subunit (CoxS/CutS family)